jgi:hypothetical protein
MTTYVRARTRRPAEPQIRFIQDPTLLVSQAIVIPDGMHGAPKVDGSLAFASTLRSLVARGIHPDRARAIVNRVAGRIKGGTMSGLGDVVADAMTWVTYGNEIINRSKTGNVGAEALKAAQNINTFLGNRGPELEAASSETLDALDETTDKLTRIASGQIRYDSVAGAFFDELGNAVRGEVIVGARSVLGAAKNAVSEVVSVVPWYVWAGGAVVGVAVIGKSLRLW